MKFEEPLRADQTIKHAFNGKLSNSTLLWCCLFFNFTQFVIFTNLSVLDLALSGMKGLNLTFKTIFFVILSNFQLNVGGNCARVLHLTVE